MKTPYFTMTPDYSPVVRMMAMQTAFAVETTQKMFELAMLPWKGMPTPYGLMRAGLCVSNPTAVKAMPEAPSTVDEVVREARLVAEKAEAVIEAAAEKTEVAAEKPKAVTKAPAAEAKPVETKPAASVKPAAAPVKPAATPAAPGVEAVAAKTAPAAPAQAEAPATPVAAAKATEATVAAFVEPLKLAAPKGEADDLTALNGVGPKLAEALNAQGIWHYSQIAAWTEANVAWVDENLPGVRGRASRDGWVAQAAALALAK